MPNWANVATPINIHGIGRSGTTLLQNILASTGFIQNCNETNGFVFSCYRGGEVLNPSHDKQAPGGTEAIATRGLHAALCAAMPSDKPSWCQKLGGIPNCVVWDDLIEPADRALAPECYPFPYAWFWRVLGRAFPHSTDILILRDWRDVVVSRCRFSGYLPQDVASDLAVYYSLMAHPASRIDHVVQFAELVAAPEATLERLFDRIGLAFPERALEAMQWLAAPAPGREAAEARQAGFSWRKEHAAVIDGSLEALVAPAIARLAERLGIEPATLGGGSEQFGRSRVRRHPHPGLGLLRSPSPQAGEGAELPLPLGEGRGEGGECVSISEQPVQEPAQVAAAGIGAVAAAV